MISTLQGTQKLDFTSVLKQQKISDFESNMLKIQDSSFYYKFKKYVHYLAQCSGLDLSVSFNILNLKPTGINKDSFDLTSLMFPETGNAGFMISPSWNWYLKSDDKVAHRWSSEGSFSLRQNRVNNVINSNGTTSEDLNFSVLNFNVMPFKYTYLYVPDSDFKFTLSIGAYYNFFNIPNEDATTFNKLFPIDAPMFKGTNASNVQGLGVKVVAGVNGFLFFTDVRYHISTKGFENSNPFKGTVFNFGIAQNLEFFEK